jgi:hypothetical protein
MVDVPVHAYGAVVFALLQGLRTYSLTHLGFGLFRVVLNWLRVWWFSVIGTVTVSMRHWVCAGSVCVFALSEPV